MSMNEKASYLKGLYDGLELDTHSKEGKLLEALVNLTGEMARQMDEMQAKIDETHDYCEELDEDLGDAEQAIMDIYDVDDDEDDGDSDGYEYDDDECCGCGCDCCSDDEDDEDDDEDEDGEYFEIVCPSCGEVINFDSTVDPENLICPNCGEKFECLVDEDDLQTLDELGDEENR